MRADPPAVTQPSMASVCPVTNEASSDASHTTARAISTGSAPRCIGVSSICSCFHPGIMAASRSAIAVSVNPGATALTRMPKRACSFAATRVSPMMPHLEAE